MEKILNFIYAFFSKRSRYFNKYVIVIAIAVFVFTCSDSYTIPEYLGYRLKISELKSQIKHYEQERDDATRKINELNTDRHTLEKYAREQFQMKRENEDIFIVK